MSLTGKQRRFLRARGHHLDPVLQVGKEGLSPAFLDALDQALAHHELVKVRVGSNALLDRRSAAEELASRTGSEIAQVLGNTLLLYRPHPEEPQIVLP